MAEQTTSPQPAPAPDQKPAQPQRPLIMRLLGLRRREGKLLPIVPTRWGWALIIVVAMVGGAAGFAEYSMQPDFCRSCHLMEPYYQAWHSSSHKNVPCSDCHFEPGLKNTLKGKWQASSQAVKYITQTYGSKPHAEIQDASCMRGGCHEKRLLEGKVNWPVKTVRGTTVTIRFDHAPHLTQDRRGKQLRCVSCHSQIVQGQHLVVTLDTCFLCHFKDKEHGRNEEAVGGCTSCHEAPKTEMKLATGTTFRHVDYVAGDRKVECKNCHADSIKGEGLAPKQFCWNCHNQEKQIAMYPETALIHKQHVTDHKVDCASCHVQIEHNLTAGAPKTGGLSLAAHAQLDQSSCGQCHERMHGGPAEMYRGVGARGIPGDEAMPSPMQRAQVDCIACHKARKETSQSAVVIGQTFVAMQQACDNCHGTKYEGSLDTWRKQIATQLQFAQKEYDNAAAAVAGASLPATKKLQADRFLDDAAYNIRFVRLAHGVHNINYAMAALSASIDSSKKAAALAAEPPPEARR